MRRLAASLLSSTSLTLASPPPPNPPPLASVDDSSFAKHVDSRPITPATPFKDVPRDAATVDAFGHAVLLPQKETFSASIPDLQESPPRKKIAREERDRLVKEGKLREITLKVPQPAETPLEQRRSLQGSSSANAARVWVEKSVVIHFRLK